jgi:hypothetical protein
VTRLLAFLAFAPPLVAAAVAFASCDTGGEPPIPDSGSKGGLPDVTTDTPIIIQVDTSLFDGGTDNDGSSGTDASCLPACTSSEVCVDGGCVTCGSEAGQPCCSDEEIGTCSGAGSLVCGASGVCAPCGGPGQSCCGLNTCGDGGCCMNGTCAAEGEACEGVDGGTCQAGACGGPSGCGVSGGPCCKTWCTAPGTLCEASDAGTQTTTEAGITVTSTTPGQCHECGKGGDPCCNGSSCGSSLVCNGASICAQK